MLSGRIIEDFRFLKLDVMWIGVYVVTFWMTLLSLFTESYSWTTLKKEEEGFTERWYLYTNLHGDRGRTKSLSTPLRQPQSFIG